jgi:hypothetical protein
LILPTAHLPTALRDLLVRSRKLLKQSMAPEASVLVQFGWAEVRAIYALHTALKVSRDQCAALRATLRQNENKLDQNRADVSDYELLNNQSILALLTAVDRAMSGVETNTDALFETHRQLKAFIARARKADRMRAQRTSAMRSNRRTR